MAEENTFWMSCYQVLFGDPADLGQERVSIADLDDAVVAVIHASLPYQHVDPLVIVSSTPDRGIQLAPITGAERTLERDLYLLILAPYETAGRPVGELIVRARIAEVAGLATLQLGRNALFVHRYDNVLSFAKGTVSASTPALKTPDVQQPHIDPASLTALADLDSAMRRVDIRTRDRLGLALRWYDASFRAGDGIDDFLAVWFALEVADGSHDKVVRSLNRRFAEVYEISEQEAAHEFQLGKVFNLRGQIVHDGARPAGVP